MARWVLSIGTLLITATAPVLFAILAGIALGAVIDVDANLRYFEIVAQIIPILVLALAIEQRHFFRDRPPPLPSVLRERLPEWFADLDIRLFSGIYALQVVTLLILIGAEGAALWAVAAVEPSPELFAASTTGLVTGAIALVVTPVILGLKAWLEEQVDIINEAQ